MASSADFEQKLKLEDVFGENVFNDRAQVRYLPKTVYDKVKECVKTHQTVPSAEAEIFASGLLRWAVERGATHYTHWFMPMTGRSAQKHDSFMKIIGDHIVSVFTGSTLSVGEPDGSSFPSGGLRPTHKARGHTVWDPSSPPFVVSHGTGATLYIPTVFFSWEGHSLDEKLPLLASGEAIARHGLRLLRAAGDDRHTTLHSNVGCEQEFFLVDADFILQRPDIVQTGRTLLGAAPPRGQALDDQYFGDLSERTMRLINDAEREMWRLGIPQTTRHKEVAPGQYEMAPIFSPGSVASDNNVLVQEILNRVAHQHGMEALFHEKPFAGLNGSGKHNNMSFGTDVIPTLYAPGATPNTNLPFMLFLAATLRACDLFGDLLRISVASASNDHRLGAAEAPPAIVSAYLGEEVFEAMQKVINEDTTASTFDTSMDLGVRGLPEFKRATTDRNRTSPMAFTGNKFEFRAVGSMQTPHRSTCFMQTIVADSCAWMADEIEKKNAKTKEQKEKAAWEVIRATFKAHQHVVFEGNAYSPEWTEEAKKRGLANLVTTPQALAQLTSQKNIDVFGRMGVMSPEVVQCRQTIWLEEYVVKLTTEADSLATILGTKVIPCATELQKSLAEAITSVKSVGIEVAESQKAYLKNVVDLLSQLMAEREKLVKCRDEMHEKATLLEQANYGGDVLVPQLKAARAPADALEVLVPETAWPLPSYTDMLFTGQVYDVSPEGGLRT